MRLTATLSVIASVNAQVGGCYWTGSKSGQFLECLPDYFIKGGCESGSRNDCNIDAGIVGTDASFGIKCCPSDRSLNFHGQEECLWIGGESGANVACGNGRAAFGRCSTSQRSGGGGDCNKMSHQVKCCDSDSTIDEDSCGWIYARYLLLSRQFKLRTKY